MHYSLVSKTIRILAVASIALMVFCSFEAAASLIQRDLFLGIGEMEYEGPQEGVAAGCGFYPNPAPSGTFAIDQDVHFTGKSSQRINLPPIVDANGQKNASISIKTPIGPNEPIQEGDSIHFSAYIRSSSVLENCIVVCYISTNGSRPLLIFPFQSSQPILQWTKIERTFQIPKTPLNEQKQTEIAVFFQLITIKNWNPSLPASGTLWVDNVKLVNLDKMVQVPMVNTRRLRTFAVRQMYSDPLITASKTDCGRFPFYEPRHALQVKALRPDFLAHTLISAVEAAYKVKDGKIEYEHKINPNWLLYKANGSPFTGNFGPYMVFHKIDVGNKDYQQHYIKLALDAVKRRGHEAVMADSVCVMWSDWIKEPAYIKDSNGSLKLKYTNNQEWANAMIDFLSTVYTALKSANPSVLFFVNSGCGGVWSEFPWREYLKYCDGVLIECNPFYRDESTDLPWRQGIYLGSNYWKKLLLDSLEIAASINQSRRFITIVQSMFDSGDVAKRRFSLASYLLGEYSGSYLGFCTDKGLRDASSAPEYETLEVANLNIGFAIEPYRYDSSGLYIRRFSNGLVLVNPDENQTKTFNLTESYFDLDGSVVLPGIKQIGPVSALILLKRSDIEISINSDKSEAKPGDEFYLIVTFKNSGSRPASNITLDVPLPRELQYISSASGSYNEEYHKVTWSIESLPNGQASAVTCRVKIKH